jgi:hypothetical protein
MQFPPKASIARSGFGVAAAAFLIMLSVPPWAWADPIPSGWQAANMKPISEKP